MKTPTHKPTWYILGVGAIGSLWACYWRKAGFPIVLITRSNEPRSDLHLQIHPDQACDIQSYDVQSLSAQQLCDSTLRIEYLLVTTKAQDTLNAVNSICEHIAPDATVIILQNGMAGKQLPSLLKTQRLVTAITSDGAYRPEPQTVVHAGRGKTYIGADNTLCDYLPVTDLDIQPCKDIEFRQWQKLCVNCAINGLTAIHHCQNGALLNNPIALTEIEQLCRELISIGNRIGFNLDYDFLLVQVLNTLKETASNYSSMYQDIERHQPTEIDFLNGYICQLARQHQLASPANESIVLKIKQLEQT